MVSQTTIMENGIKDATIKSTYTMEVRMIFLQNSVGIDAHLPMVILYLSSDDKTVLLSIFSVLTHFILYIVFGQLNIISGIAATETHVTIRFFVQMLDASNGRQILIHLSIVINTRIQPGYAQLKYLMGQYNLQTMLLMFSIPSYLEILTKKS